MPRENIVIVGVPCDGMIDIKKIKGIEITRLANVSHTDMLKEENKSGAGYYRLIRLKIDKPSERGTDVWAIEQDIISITPRHIGRAGNSSPRLPTSLGDELMRELTKKR